MPRAPAIAARAAASRLPCARASPSSFQGAQSLRGSASQAGWGRLPAIVVGKGSGRMMVCLRMSLRWHPRSTRPAAGRSLGMASPSRSSRLGTTGSTNRRTRASARRRRGEACALHSGNRWQEMRRPRGSRARRAPSAGDPNTFIRSGMSRSTRPPRSPSGTRRAPHSRRPAPAGSRFARSPCLRSPPRYGLLDPSTPRVEQAHSPRASTVSGTGCSRHDGHALAHRGAHRTDHLDIALHRRVPDFRLDAG